jgi:hypothetical protein
VREDVGIVRRQRLELVRRADEGQAGYPCNTLGKGTRKLWRCVQSGADRSTALCQGIKVLYAFAQPRDAVRDLRGVTLEFLTERQWRCVLGVGAADLHDLRERALFPDELAVQFGKRRDQL